MKALILKVMDWDSTWYGIGWHRPSRETTMTSRDVLLIATLTSLVLIVPILPVVWFVLEPFMGDQAVWITALLGQSAVLINFSLQAISAGCWNERAARLKTQGELGGV